MLFSTVRMAAVAALVSLTYAQTDEELAALEKAQSQYPSCALECMATLVPESSCEETDIQCLCTNEELSESITGCALQGCTIFEGLTTKNITMTMCQAPVRDKHLQPLVIGLTGGALAGLAFIMRLCSTFSKSGGRSLGMDDHLASVAVLLSIPPTVFSLTLTKNGLGKDMWTLPLDNIKNVLMYYYLGSIFYIATITMVKLSILAFILRVFPEKRFRKVVWGVCGLVGAYGVAFVLATALQCWPAEYAWNQVDENFTGTCNNIHLQGWMSAIFNIIIDIILLVLPLKNLWGLHMEAKKKLMIMFMFSLGIFVTIVSVVRLQSLILFANSANITWDYTAAAYWSTLEIHVGIICACLPSCRHLLISLGASVLKSTRFGSNAYGNSKGHGSKSNTLQSGNGIASIGKGGEYVHAQETPKHGDEGDFVPLVESPHHRAFDKGSTMTSNYSVSVSKASNGDSV